MPYLRHHPLRTALIKLAALCALALVVLASAHEGEARLHPYYVLQGASFGQVSPRILFVLDTSGSMARRAQLTRADCEWNQCENGSGSAQSRVAAARKAIKQVVDETRDQASFAFMTFDQERTPNSVPSDCSNSRFAWVDTYLDISWNWLEQFTGYRGRWVLCDSNNNRPYPFLRWDELGEGAVISSNNATGDVPPSPLISTDEADMRSSSNANRRVQWFPRFDGVRVHYDCSDTEHWEIVDASTGEYGKNSSQKQSDVCGHDFYYWPYVDGFPGYSQMWGALYDDCTYSNNKGWQCDWHQMGVIEEDGSAHEAALYGPFYLDLEESDVNPNYWGPQSEQEAEDTLLRYVSPLIEGGVDVDGGTAWTNVVGPIPSSPPKNNAIFSHSTVSSYLKFVTNIESTDVCAPTVAVLVTDGQPDCSKGNNPDCGKLYGRLADLRNELNVDTYVVGFFEGGGALNEMACAAAGACSSNQCGLPCENEPADNWDTCRESTDPQNDCAFLADSPEQLVKVLTGIVQGALGLDVSAGPGTASHEFGVGQGNQIGDQETLQTRVSGHTEWPGWRGHVIREVCDDRVDPEDPDSELQPWCQEPSPPFETVEETFGPCPQSRNWDAGECLQQMDYKDRRLYTNDTNNQLIPIMDGNGAASAQFEAELVALGLVDSNDSKTQADAIAAFLGGKDWPEGWKLPGIANSAPVVVRRIPPYDEELLPSVPIRDPHCGGRMLSNTQNADVPQELIDFAEDAWADKISNPSEHYRYQEAVMVGDDLGILHAFQLDSGNELWGYLPRFLLDSAAAQAEIGVENRGQPEDVDEHIYGVANTLNHGWVWDDTASDPEDHEFRHVGVFGLGAGGSEFIALDLSHMSPVASEGPVEILWTSEDSSVKTQYDAYNGQTWARPALTYELDNNLLTEKPDSYVVMGTGYVDGPVCKTITDNVQCDALSHCRWSNAACELHMSASDERGRVLMLADTLTGDLEPDGTAVMPAPSDPVYEPYFGSVVDPAVASHCRSRFWAEMEETYIVDPAGRLFRWDLGHPSGAPQRDHAADSVQEWGGIARPVVRFPACQGTGDSCTVQASNKGDPFAYGAAVTANDRIDDLSVGSDQPPGGIDQMLVALISGSSFDDKLDWSKEDNDYHSSLYLLVDDHSDGNDHEGFDIPGGAPKMTMSEVGSHSSYLRMALSDIPRERTFQPYPGGPTYTESGTFSRRARPLRAPRIMVKGVVDDTDPDDPKAIDGVEVVFVEFVVYESGTGECDSRWYDPDEEEWHFDQGATYRLTFRLTVGDGAGFDFAGGYSGDDADFGTEPTGLTLVGEQAEQILEGECADGNCGPTLAPPAPMPCDRNQDDDASNAQMSVPLSRTELSGFAPVE